MVLPAVCSFGGTNSSQEGPRLHFNRSSAVHYALAHNLELKAARQVIEAAQSASMDAGRLNNPAVNVRGQSDAIDAREGGHTVEFGLEQSFPLTDRLRREKNVASIEIELATSEVAVKELQLSARVAKALVRLQQEDAEMKFREEKLALTRKLAEFIASRVESAESSPVEAKRLRIELFQETQALAELKIAHASSRADFAELLGLAPTREFFLEASHFLEEPDALPSVDADWLTVHPLYRLRQQMIDLASERMALSKAERWGDLSVELYFESEYGGDSERGLERENFAGIGFSVPLPLHQQRRGEIEARRADRQRAEIERQIVVQGLHREVRVQAERAESLRQQLLIFEQDISSLMAENALELERAYGAGQIDFDALLRAREQYLEIRSHQLELRASYEQARIDWAAATGQTQHF